MLSLVVALAVSADPAPTTTYARQLISDVFEARRIENQETKRNLIASLKISTVAATGADKQLVDRMLRFLENEPPPNEAFIEMADLLRELIRISRGRWDEERAAHAAFLALPMFAQSMGRDPAPIQKEAVEKMRDLVARYPKQGRAHGLLATAMQAARADPKTVLPELTRCAELEPDSWCTEHRTQLLAELTRPRCSGLQLKKPMTMQGVDDQQPFLETKDFAAISVDPEGALAIETTAEAKPRLAVESKRLVGQRILVKLGGDVVSSALALEPIRDGRIRLSPGKGRAFALAELCSTVVTPSAP